MKREPGWPIDDDYHRGEKEIVYPTDYAALERARLERERLEHEGQSESAPVFQDQEHYAQINFNYLPLDPNAFYRDFWEDNVRPRLEFELGLLESVRDIQAAAIHEGGTRYYFANKQGIALAPTNHEPQRFHVNADLYLFPRSQQVQLIIGAAVQGISIMAGYRKEHDTSVFYAAVRNSAFEDHGAVPLEINRPEVLCTQLSGPAIAPAGTPAFWIHAAVKSNLLPIIL